MTIRNYGSYDDAELRRALGADPDDIDAVIEAAKRFAAQGEPGEDEDEDSVMCPECGHEFEVEGE
jgi:hypothetical protein